MMEMKGGIKMVLTESKLGLKFYCEPIQEARGTWKEWEELFCCLSQIESDFCAYGGSKGKILK